MKPSDRSVVMRAPAIGQWRTDGAGFDRGCSPAGRVWSKSSAIPANPARASAAPLAGMARRDRPGPRLLLLFLLPALTLFSVPRATAQDALKAAESFGSEANPTGNPIGGGDGYDPILRDGDHVVGTADELLAALRVAKAGDIVFVRDDADIDLTGKHTVILPAGITLAGGRGFEGKPGPRIVDRLKKSHQLMRTGGRGIRVTGLRFEGPFGGTDRVGFHTRFLSIGHSHTEVDNCEIYNFNVVGLGVASDAIDVQIHHNYIHDCTRGGLGYGVSTSSSDVHIIANRFNNCRHHIASSGSPGSGYEAAWNLVMGKAISHHFDMHGGRDRGDATDIAGDWMHIHHNTFQGGQRHVVIRGVPSQGARVHNNWFSGPLKKRVRSGGNTRVYRNVYGPDKTLEE